MIDFRLIASTVGRDADHDAFTSVEKQWLERTSAYPRPGRLAFLVFHIQCDYWLPDKFFVGLDSFEVDDGVIVAGRVEDFYHAAQAVPRDSFEDILAFYRYVRQIMNDFGYLSLME